MKVNTERKGMPNSDLDHDLDCKIEMVNISPGSLLNKSILKEETKEAKQTVKPPQTYQPKTNIIKRNIQSASSKQEKRAQSKNQTTVTEPLLIKRNASFNKQKLAKTESTKSEDLKPESTISKGSSAISGFRIAVEKPTSVTVTISDSKTNSITKEVRQSFESPGRNNNERKKGDQSMNIEELSGSKDTPLGRVNDFFK